MNPRQRPLMIGAAILVAGWTVSISALLVGWRSAQTRSNQEILTLKADLCAQTLRACSEHHGVPCPADSAELTSSGLPGVSILVGRADRRLLPPGSPPEERFVPSQGTSCLVAERDLPYDRIVRLEIPTRTGDLPRSAWALSGVSGALGTLLPTGLLLWLLRRERRRTRSLIEIARNADRGGGPAVHDPDLGEEGHMVATLGSDLRRRRILSHWEERRLGRLLDSLSEGVVLLDSRLRVLVCNTSAARTLRFGSPKAGARGRPVVSLSRDLGFLDDLRRAVSQNRSSSFSIERDGSVHIARIWPVPADPEGGGWLVSLRDVTDRIKAERLQTRLVADASHEFKTPLTSIRGWTETLLDDETDEFRRKALERVVQGTRHLEEIVRDLLDLGRLAEAPVRPPEDVLLREACQEAIGTVDRQISEKDARISLDVAEGAVLKGHRNQIVRALVNLLSNAIRHSPQGGAIEVRLRGTPETWILEVADQGSGVPPEAMDHLFERFYRADHGRSRDLGGTGLGLAIVKETAEAHGGHAECESPPGHGATFRIVLSRSDRSTT